MTYEELRNGLVQDLCENAYLGTWYGNDGLQMIIEAIEKQIPKKPIKDDWAKNICYCPNCKRWFNGYHKPHHCKCGQAILWE